VPLTLGSEPTVAARHRRPEIVRGAAEPRAGDAV